MYQTIDDEAIIDPNGAGELPETVLLPTPINFPFLAQPAIPHLCEYPLRPIQMGTLSPPPAPLPPGTFPTLILDFHFFVDLCYDMTIKFHYLRFVALDFVIDVFLDVCIFEMGRIYIYAGFISLALGRRRYMAPKIVKSTNQKFSGTASSCGFPSTLGTMVKNPGRCGALQEIGNELVDTGLSTIA